MPAEKSRQVAGWIPVSHECIIIEGCCAAGRSAEQVADARGASRRILVVKGGGDDLTDLIADASVQKWRAAHFFESDFDFAYAFGSWNDALSVSRPVAEAW